MYNFRIEFAYSWSIWLLLLLIPAIAIPLFLHFRQPKRYRRTRARIISLVLHLTIMALVTSVLSGMVFAYEVDNLQNEIILLVDVSDTQEVSKEERDDFVQLVIDESGGDGFRVGVVTFGFTQKYAVPLTHDVEKIYDQYMSAELPDTSATDIAAALRYAADLFENPKSSKIVVISDGKETDERAMSAIGAITARGILIDTVYISSGYEEDNFQVVSVELPEYHINLNEECNVSVTFRSMSAAENVSITLYDNGRIDGDLGTQVVDVSAGITTVTFKNVFSEKGLHELQVRIAADDQFDQNNRFFTYAYLDIYNKVLVLERYNDESVEIEKLLKEDDAVGYQITTKNIVTEREEIPATIDELRQYDQVILNNIANEDFPEGFDEILYNYVYNYGGGLFTVGGSDLLSGEAHAYNRADMRNTLYQQMLPVQAIDYTPPVGVVIIIDISGSMDMDGGNGYTKRELAKQGAIACLEALTERDYVGIMTLDSVYGVVLPMTSTFYKSNIVTAIDGIDGTGGTVFSDAISRAGQILTDLKSVDRRHVIIVTDGVPTGSDKQNYLAEARNNYINNKITLSVVGIGMDENSSAAAEMELLVSEDFGHGRLHLVRGRPSDIALEMYEDLNVAEIKEVVPEPFNPVVANPLSSLFNGVEYGIDGESRRAMNARLGGFYGVKVRSDDYLILTGEYDVPLYAQWKFGAGSVGSFMSDLSGKWSDEFLADANAKRFLLNVVANLMPTENIRPNEITANLVEENYITQLNVFTDLKSGETVRGTITNLTTGDSISLNNAAETENDSFYVTMFLSSANSYSRSSFVIKEAGTYHILLEKIDNKGNVSEKYETYKSFSFSEEYSLFRDEAEEPENLAMLRALAARGNGAMIDDLEAPWGIFENFVTKLPRSFDPRWLFMILAMVCFLLDIVVRKFKFKWIHELIREHKQKKLSQPAAKSPEKKDRIK